MGESTLVTIIGAAIIGVITFVWRAFVTNNALASLGTRIGALEHTMERLEGRIESHHNAYGHPGIVAAFERLSSQVDRLEAKIERSNNETRR